MPKPFVVKLFMFTTLTVLTAASLSATTLAASHRTTASDDADDDTDAQISSRSREDYNSPRAKRFSLEAGLSYTQFNYAEDVAPPAKSTENGGNPGLTLAGRYRTADVPEALQLQGIIDYTSGSTAYDGALQDNTGNYMGPATRTTSDTFTNVEGRVIFNLATLQPGRTFLRGYTGLGIRSWTRKLDIEEDYSWAYLPVGMRYETKIGENIDLALDATVKLMFYGSVQVHLSDLNPEQGNPTLTLGNKPGVKLQVPVSFRLTPSIRLVATPFYEFSEIGQSDVADLGDGTGIHEPSSRTYQYGGILSVAADL